MTKVSMTVLSGILVGAIAFGGASQVAAQSEATSAKGVYETTMVSGVDGSFVDGVLKIKGKGGKVKFDLRGVILAEETAGFLRVETKVNDNPVTFEFPFVVEGKEGEAENRVRLRAFLTDLVPLNDGDVVAVGDVGVFLGEISEGTDEGTEEDGMNEDGEDPADDTEEDGADDGDMDEGTSSVKAQEAVDEESMEDELTMIGAPGFVFAAKPEQGNDRDDDSSADRDDPRGPNGNGPPGQDRDK